MKQNYNINKNIWASRGKTMKQINIYLTSAIIAVVSVGSHAATSDESALTLNNQKTSIRDEMSLTDLQNSLYQKKNEGLQLQIDNKMLKIQKKRVYNSDETLVLDEISDPVFGEDLTEEDQMSFGNNKGYGQKKKNGDSAYSMNTNDKKRRASSLDESELEGGKINIQELQKRIQEMVSSEVNSQKESNIAPYAPISTVPLISDTVDLTVDSIPDMANNNNEVSVSEKGSKTSLVEMEVLKMVKFGDKSRATIVAKFEIKNGLRRAIIEGVELELEEGQIYTYYGKVYLVKTISDKTVIVTNSTDKIDIIQHL
jgi:hypothetical protein